MKKFLFLILGLFPTFINAQGVNHFTHEDAKWNVLKRQPAATIDNPNQVGISTTVYGFQGDTLINGNQYYKVFSSASENFTNLHYQGLMRYENQQVHYIDTTNIASVLYDFSLEVGDSVSFNINGTTLEWLEIIEIDSIAINGINYKRMKFEEPTISAFDQLNEVWIEGIGSIHGPLFPDAPRKFSEETPDTMLVICTFADAQSVFDHPNYDFCYANLSIQQQENTSFQVYPNPFTSNVYLNFENQQSYDVQILNNIGQLVKRISAYSSGQAIELNAVIPGIYFLVVNDQTTSYTIKIAKTN